VSEAGGATQVSKKVVMESSLSKIEQDILLLADAPEIELKCETLFAYVNNDITRGMFRDQVPLPVDVELQFLAKQFPIAGGDIRNVVSDAAFLAAQDGKLVTMKQLGRALTRQMMKQGKSRSSTVSNSTTR